MIHLNGKPTVVHSGTPETLSELCAADIKRNVRQVPIISPVARKLALLLGEQNHSLRRALRLIEMDPNLTMQILRTANSVSFARNREIHSVKLAIPRLGEQVLYDIAIRASETELKLHPMESFLFERNGLWVHSVYAALAAKQLAGMKPGLNLSLAYTAALLHDSGKAILSMHLRCDSEELSRRCSDPHDLDFCQLESDLLGMTHAQAGATLAQHWNLPGAICEALRLHHTPQYASSVHRRLVETIHVADIVALLADAQSDEDRVHAMLDQEQLQHFSLSRERLDKLVARVKVEFQTLCSVLIG